eukprot:g1784.t1
MRLETYRRVEAQVNEWIRTQHDLVAGDEKAFEDPEVTYDLLFVIYGQRYQTHIIMSTSRIKKQMQKYVCWYEEHGADIYDIAAHAEVNFSPYLLARRFVEHYYGTKSKKTTALIRELMESGKQEQGQQQEPQQEQKGDAVALAGALAAGPQASAPSAPVAARIEDPRLRENVKRCLEMDLRNSPYIDRIRHSIGEEYEFVLQEKLRTRGIAFESEETLRSRGMSKTPDVKLCFPVAVRSPLGRGGWATVYWIDSKAMFGDEKTQKENEEQFEMYVNRYGPGMVVYWFGFIDSLNTDPDVLLCDDWPSTWVLSDGTCC